MFQNLLNTKTSNTRHWGLAALAALVIGGIFVTGASLAAPAQQTAAHDDAGQSAAPIALSASLDHPKVLEGTNQPIYLLLQLDAAPIPAQLQQQRPPLNLSLVLDRSGSMEDRGKIEFLRHAAKFAVDRLDSADHLSIVEYDDQISVMLPSQPVADKEKIKAMIDALTPRNSTNLTGGMMRGVEEVKTEIAQMPRTDALNRVVLLSDGLANTGVTDPAEIKALVRQAKSDGVRISAMGLGRDYDEDLMQMIAEHGGGRYYYIEHPSQTSRIFEQELDTLFTTVAKDPSLVIEIGAQWESVRLMNADESPHDKNPDNKNQEQASRNGVLTVDIENMYAGEQRSYLLRLTPKAETFATAGRIKALPRITLSYLDTGQVVSHELAGPVAIEVVDAQAAVDQAANKDVIVEARLVEAERAHVKAVGIYESGDHEAAAQQLEMIERSITEANAVLDDDRLASKAEALRVEKRQMATSAASPDEQLMYLKSTKHRLYQTKQGKRSLYNLKLGDTGYEVERLQKALKDGGYYGGPVDGIYSEAVQSAVEEVQRQNNLPVDGVAGPATQEKVDNF